MSQAVAFREAEEVDLAEVARIHVAAWKVAYRGLIADNILDGLLPEHRLPLWTEWQKAPGVRLYLAVLESRIVGFLRLCPARPLADPPDHFSEITHLYLEPARIGSGVGRRLFEHGLDQARLAGYRGVVLWVLEENSRARSFYEGFGLRLDGTRLDQPKLLGPNVFEVRYALRWAEPPDSQR